MYCVKCGVKLQNGVKQCPLCMTPVWDPNGEFEENKAEGTFSETLPKHTKSSSLPEAALIGVLFILGMFAIFVICREIYGQMAWGGYAIFGMLLFYIIFILPMWFRDPNPVVFIPCDHVAIGVYLLYICLKTGGHWFLSFAFPIVGVFCILNTTIAVILKYVGKGKMYLISAVWFSISGICILIEFLGHITFGNRMFLWSLYAATPTFIIGCFFMLAALIKPLRNAVLKWFIL